MKLKFIIPFLFVFFFAIDASARVSVPVGEMEFLTKVADLPDTEEFMIEEGSEAVDAESANSTTGKYADIGILYKQYVIAYIPIWTTKEPILVLFNEDDDNTYYEVEDAKMDQILKENNLDRESLSDIGFFSKIGGKLIALIPLSLILLGLWSYIEEAKKTITNR